MSLATEANGPAGQLAALHANEHPLQLYNGWFSPYGQRVWVTLEEKKIPYQYVETNSFLKEPRLLKLNPRGTVPTLVLPADSAGKKPLSLYESSIICEYLDGTYSDESNNGPRLLPADPYQKARACLWINHIDTKIVPTYYKFFYHTADVEQTRQELHDHIRAFTAAMDPEGPWFLGKQMSLVDICLAPWAARMWVLDHIKPGGAQLGGEDGVWARWKIWNEAILERQSVKDTLSDEEQTLAGYKLYVHMLNAAAEQTNGETNGSD